MMNGHTEIEGWPQLRTGRPAEVDEPFKPDLQ